MSSYLPTLNPHCIICTLNKKHIKILAILDSASKLPRFNTEEFLRIYQIIRTKNICFSPQTTPRQ